jgi:ubiquinone/menaquinone biosynthesis C-methylase UbiE
VQFSHGLEGALAYDSWFDAGWGRHAFSVEARALLRAAGPLAGLRVLDVGCGTGRITDVLARSGANVVGLDLDPAMLTVAARRTSAPFILGDAASLPFSDGSFDLTVAVTLCEFVADVGAVFAELARVTRPGGRFIVGSLNPRSPWGWLGRKRFVEAPWTEARFLTRKQLLELGSRQGAATLAGVLCAPEGLPFLGFTGPGLEALGRLAPGIGAFQVLTVTLPG